MDLGIIDRSVSLGMGMFELFDLVGGGLGFGIWRHLHPSQSHRIPALAGSHTHHCTSSSDRPIWLPDQMLVGLGTAKKHTKLPFSIELSSVMLRNGV